MSKPILLAIDDDTSVLEAVVQDLRRHYGQTYRIIRAVSGPSALDTCQQLKERDETVALFLSDQRMPGMTGVELAIMLSQSIPNLKVLLFSGQASTVDLLEKARHGGHYFTALTKPVHPTDMLKRVSESLAFNKHTPAPEDHTAPTAAYATN